MLTRLKNGSYLDLSLVVAIHCKGGHGPVPRPGGTIIIDYGGAREGQFFSINFHDENPQQYADELAALVAKAQGSENAN